MHEPSIDDRVIEELLSGTPLSGDVPAVYGGLAHAFDELRSLLPRLELATEVTAAAAVPAIALAVRSAAYEQSRAATKPARVGKVIAIKAAIVGAVLFGATAAAAATGSLPAPAQRFISHVLSNIGISVPSASGSVGGTPSRSTTAPARRTVATCPPAGKTASAGVRTSETDSASADPCVTAGSTGVGSGKRTPTRAATSRKSSRSKGAAPHSSGGNARGHRPGSNGKGHPKGSGNAHAKRSAKGHPPAGRRAPPKGSGKQKGKKVGKGPPKAGRKGAAGR